MRAVSLSGDMMIASAAHGAASRHGAQWNTTPDADAALAACSDEAITLLAVDLRTPGLDIRALMDALRSADIEHVHIIAFGQHVHETLLAQAEEAGCDEVVSRGEFERRFDSTLA